MSLALLKCPKCRTPLPAASFETIEFEPCPNCRAPLQCVVFPALQEGPRIGRAGDPLVDAEEASCFFHAEKRAAVACDSCGRFLCALCDLEMSGKHICPRCFSAGRKKGELQGLDHYRTRWANIALLLVIVPLIFFSFVLPVTAIAALVVAFVGLRKPPSIAGQRHIAAFVIAIILAIAELGGSVFFGARFIEGLTQHVRTSE